VSATVRCCKATKAASCPVSPAALAGTNARLPPTGSPRHAGNHSSHSQIQPTSLWHTHAVRVYFRSVRSQPFPTPRH
jgi:hypothetical protein